jgi:diaminopimelate decarboxylase
MSYFTYSNNFLKSEGVEIQKIAESRSTPFYCYSKKAITENYNNFKNSFKNMDVKICFSLKSNSNLSILNILSNLGAGADVVSEGELRKALRANIEANNIVFSGVGKTEEEISFAIKNHCLQINVESISELNRVNTIAEKIGNKQKVALRINPNVDPNTHGKITTGKIENKFGISVNDAFNIFKNSSEYKNIILDGIAFHIGSNINEIKPFEDSFQTTSTLLQNLSDINIPIETIDVGGGVGIENINFSYSNYSNLISEYFDTSQKQIIIEPGRSISANTGILVSKILYIKKTEERKFIIIDAGMNDWMRAALYDAQHEVVPIEKKQSKDSVETMIVGPICETTDQFISSKEYFDVKEGEYLAILNTGAYGSSMSSNYNVRPLLEEVMIDGNSYYKIRSRQKFEDLINNEIVID